MMYMYVCIPRTLTLSVSNVLSYHTISTFQDLEKEAFENMVRKVENAGNQHFLLSSPCFLPFPKQISFFQSYLFCHLQVISIWTNPKMSYYKELT